ncbi:hypothetical protein QAD02_009965 [Eretmocerus hayati]|uniref:Uncharacterized protein n=1 Tax=Eretmocerus hayati TaxID=131215 RepID=A0ACC2NB50_9HYME|nr:hypothetical protein QAD02_009965 [Eretmocerus hayati]
MENDDAININQLNDDCLVYILEFLPLEDRLCAELVCKRWYCICNLLWQKFQKFDITDDCYATGENNEDYNMKLLKQVFSRCAQYITVLNISNVLKVDQIILLDFDPHLRNSKKKNKEDEKDWQEVKEISLRCENLESLTLGSMFKIDDTYLSTLLNRNNGIRSFYLVTNNELKIQNKFRIPSKNLETLIIDCYSFHIDSLDFQALNESNKLKNLMLTVAFDDKDDLVLHNFKPKNLEQLHLNSSIRCVPRIISELADPSRLKVVSVISCDGSQIENLVNALIHYCKNLEGLRIEGDFSDFQLRIISNSLPKLVCLDIGFTSAGTDEEMKHVNKNLKCLSAPSNFLTDQGISNLLKRAEILEKLDLCDSQYLSNNAVNILIDAMEVRIKQNNLTPLEVGVEYAIDIGNTPNPCPLLKFTIGPMNMMYNNYINL